MTEKIKDKLNSYLGLLKKGNAEVLDAIYSLVGGQMFALAKSIAKNRADAEDILQTAFIKIAQNANKYQDGSNAYAWIMKLTRNTALDYLRKQKRRAEENIDEFFSLSAGDYDQDKRDNAILLEQAIKKLNKDEKKLIYYAYYLDMTLREIAKEVGVGKSTVQRALKSAEEKLKTYLVGTNDGL